MCVAFGEASVRGTTPGKGHRPAIIFSTRRTAACENDSRSGYQVLRSVFLTIWQIQIPKTAAIKLEFEVIQCSH